MLAYKKKADWKQKTKNMFAYCKMNVVYFFACAAYVPRNMPIRVNKMSTWLGYKLKSIDYVNSIVPKGTEVANMRILSQDTAEPKLLFNIYESQSSLFNGVRFEVVTMVKQVKNPKNVHFVVLECFSNTLHWDPVNGIQLPQLNCNFNYSNNDIHLNCSQGEKVLHMRARLGRSKHITKMFAVDANLLCFYRDSENGVKLMFDEKQIMQDVNLLSHVRVNTNIWNECRGKLTHCFVHNHPMDFTADMIKFDL